MHSARFNSVIFFFQAHRLPAPRHITFLTETKEDFCKGKTFTATAKDTAHPDGVFLAESVRFELTVGRPITSFQDWLLKPLGQLSIGETIAFLKANVKR